MKGEEDGYVDEDDSNRRRVTAADDHGPDDATDERPDVTLLDGPMGTALEARGLTLPAPIWTAEGVIDHPEFVRAAHADYARAGATVHSTATFRTTGRALADHPWKDRWREAVEGPAR